MEGEIIDIKKAHLLRRAALKLALEEPIKHLKTEITINPPEGPIFLAILCQSGIDWSNTMTIPSLGHTFFCIHIETDKLHPPSPPIRPASSPGF